LGKGGAGTPAVLGARQGRQAAGRAALACVTWPLHDRRATGGGHFNC